MSRLDALRRGTLGGATSLNLSQADLTGFPDEIFGLADTLEVLDLSRNALTALPSDLSRLRRLRILFCSGNRFTRLPPALGDCTALTQIGFRGTQMKEVPAEALPPAVRWLTLTDNQIETLPSAIGERPALQKLMLAGNHLSQLPESLSGAGNLELLRVSANRLPSLPGWLAGLPRLAWLAWAGNPFDRGKAGPDAVRVAWDELQVGPPLGEGASGLVYEAVWRHGPDGSRQRVALKLFKGAMTSDGLPEREMAACLAAGPHPNLMGALGRLTGHPAAAQGLVMPLLPPEWVRLAGPPSFESCSRDVYEPDLKFDLRVALRLARATGAAASHMHLHGLLHGDLYAHNLLWDGTEGEAVLSDFGAASFVPSGDGLQKLDVLAWGLLLGELLDRCDQASAALRGLQMRCVQPNPAARPDLQEALRAMG